MAKLAVFSTKPPFQTWQLIRVRKTKLLIMINYFESPFKGKPLADQVNNPNIIIGRFSYYSGYYHGHSFDDCARFLSSEPKDIDKLIIGSFCSIGSGASFIMAGNQGHRYQPDALALYASAGYERTGPFGDYTNDPLSVFMQKSIME